MPKAAFWALNVLQKPSRPSSSALKTMRSIKWKGRGLDVLLNFQNSPNPSSSLIMLLKSRLLLFVVSISGFSDCCIRVSDYSYSITLMKCE